LSAQSLPDLFVLSRIRVVWNTVLLNTAAMRTALMVFSASLAMVLAGCGSTIKPEAAAGSVTGLVSKQTGFKPNDVRCPSGVDADVGKEFECHFTGPEGKDYTAHMKVTKVEGDDVQFYIKTEPSK
jgi:hypothetical protein